MEPANQADWGADARYPAWQAEEEPTGKSKARTCFAPNRRRPGGISC